MIDKHWRLLMNAAKPLALAILLGLVPLSLSAKDDARLGTVRKAFVAAVDDLADARGK